MDIGIGLDATLQLSFADQAHLAQEAARLDYTEALAELDRMRQRGATLDEVADAFPPELLTRVGYYGTPEGMGGVGWDTCLAWAGARPWGERPAARVSSPRVPSRAGADARRLPTPYSLL
jgi:hypothetical protein